MTALLKQLAESVIGEGVAINTAFGKRPLVYADYTASGRALDLVEQFIQDKVLPFYANTHSESSLTGRQSTVYREEARQAVKSSVNATHDHSVVFCGSGATAAIQKLIGMLKLDSYQAKPLVLIGPYEHHSNELPWRELNVDLVVIPLNEQGLIDQVVLQHTLEENTTRELIVGSFSAASNVTGVISDVKGISELLHQYGALSCWDYAAAAPYVEIDVSNSSDHGDNSLDAVFISTHKFIGGPGTPGILVVKDSIAKNEIPVVPAGGTVSFVAPDRHRYIANIERREEGGTPAIVESIRAGLVFKIKDQIGAKNIEKLEAEHLAKAFSLWESNPNIDVLGGTDNKRLSIVSLRILACDKELHYGFVVALLNDLFGIQVRGGCSCAGPYAHTLLAMDEGYSRQIEDANVAGDMVLRPGWVRLNFNYFIEPETVDYLIRAIDWVATNGVYMLPFYRFDPSSGTWVYYSVPASKPSSLDELFEQKPKALEKISVASYAGYLQQADQILCNHQSLEVEPADVSLAAGSESLRWFMQPGEVNGAA